MLPFIVNTADPNQAGLLYSFDSPGAGIDPDFVFRDIQLAFFHRPVVPTANGAPPWQDDWLDTDTFQFTVGDRDAQPTSGTFPIGVLAGTITANSVANPTVVTTSGAHNLITGDKVLIFGSNSTPSIDGLYTVTVTDGTHFTIPVNVTVAGTTGQVYDATGLDALNWNEDVTAFTSALNTILTKHSYANVTGALLSAGQYNFEGVTNGAIPSFYSPLVNSLIPQSGVAITIVSAGSASSEAQQIVTLYQAPVAYATPSTPLPVAAIAATVTQAGSGTANKIYAITLTSGTYGGTFSVSLTCITPSAGTFGLIANGGVTASDFQTQLVNATGLQITDFNVTRVNDVLNVEFTGTQGNSDAVALSVTNIDLQAPLGVSGFINFNTFSLFERFAAAPAGTNELTFTMSIRRTRATGEQAEYFIQDVILKRNLVQGVALIPVPMDVFFTQAQSDARYLRSNANSHLLTGNTFTVDSGATLALASGSTLNLFGTSSTAVTGTGAIVLATAPTLTNAAGFQEKWAYDSSNYLTVTTASNGRPTLNAVGSDPSLLQFSFNGTPALQITMSTAVIFNGSGLSSFGASTPGVYVSGYANFCVNTGTPIAGSSGNGIGTGGAGDTMSLIAVGVDRVIVSATLMASTVDIQTAIGKTIKIVSGTNAKAGTFTLVAGVATVANTSVTANSVILVTLKTLGGTRTGNPDIVPTATTGFVATGGIADTSTYNFTILEVA